MIRLTDEEIGNELDLEVEKTYPCSDGGSISTVSVDNVAKAQLRKVVEWGDEDCPHATGGTPKKSECYRCWQALLEEVRK